MSNKMLAVLDVNFSIVSLDCPLKIVANGETLDSVTSIDFSNRTAFTYVRDDGGKLLVTDDFNLMEKCEPFESMLVIDSNDKYVAYWDKDNFIPIHMVHFMSLHLRDNHKKISGILK